VFLLNFEEPEVTAITEPVTQIDKENLTKRIEKYKEGGTFAVTYR
jgi:hypothetical protein